MFERMDKTRDRSQAYGAIREGLSALVNVPMFMHTFTANGPV